jgi:alpha-tubulin suppressor-like RCC1 family protein
MSRESDFLVWGSNQHNLLSQLPTKYFNEPTALHLPYEIVSICASEKHVSFVTEDGGLYSYGSNIDGRLGVSSKVVKETGCLDPVKVQLPGKVTRVESGFSHMIALVDTGVLLAWGLGEYGALGTGEFKTSSLPTKVKLGSKVISSLKQISCGAMHTGFLTKDGKLYLCGSN